MKKSELRKYISEALTPDEASKVDAKYKEIYAGMMGDKPLKMKRYDNPDKVAYGRAIKLIQKESAEMAEKKLTAAEKRKKEEIIMSLKKQKGGKDKLEPVDYAVATDRAKKLAEDDLDIGHQDDEPRMIKKDIYNMGKYAMELYKKLDQYDDMDSEVDFPHWWQSKITKAKSMLQSAYDYLDGEEKISQIDAIMEKEEKLPVNDIKKAIRALLKKEGGAAGLGPILKLAKDFDGVTQIDVEDILDNDMKDVEKHRDGDYILKETGKDIAGINMDDYKKTNMEENRLNELVKAALMGPISEKQASTDKYDKNPALTGKQSELPDGLQKAIIKKAGGKVEEAAQYTREIALKIIELIRSSGVAPSDIMNALRKEFGTSMDESFDSLVKKVDKSKGYSKKDAQRVAGYIANRKRAGAGKGPTKKMKKREGIKELILRELRGNINEAEVSPQIAAGKALKVADKLEKAPEMDKLAAQVAKNPKLMAQLEKAVKDAGVNVELAEDESGLDMGDLKTMALNLAKKGKKVNEEEDASAAIGGGMAAFLGGGTLGASFGSTIAAAIPAATSVFAGPALVGALAGVGLFILARKAYKMAKGE